MGSSEKQKENKQSTPMDYNGTLTTTYFSVSLSLEIQ